MASECYGILCKFNTASYNRSDLFSQSDLCAFFQYLCDTCLQKRNSAVAESKHIHFQYTPCPEEKPTSKETGKEEGRKERREERGREGRLEGWRGMENWSGIALNN